MELMEIGFVVPVLVRLTSFELDVPTFCQVVKSNMLDIESSEPIPAAVTICGLVESLATIVTVAERGPTCVGTNVTVN